MYGLDVNKLNNFITTPKPKKISGGYATVLIAWNGLTLKKIELKQGKTFTLRTKTGEECTLFIQYGTIANRKITINEGFTSSFKPKTNLTLIAKKSSVIYIFYGPYKNKQGQAKYQKTVKTSDYREKYWGSIETIVNKEYAGKRIICNKKKNSSLEYHCKKTEAYYIHSGRLLLRLRAGRAEDKFFKLSAGSVVFIPPGLMHQRGGIDNSTIIELSDHDEDSDSYLVEDGIKTKMPNLK